MRLLTARLDGSDVLFDYAAGNLPAGVEGETRYERLERKLVVTLSIDSFASFEQNQGRGRFTFCHEIGHGVLHQDELARLSTMPHSEASLLRRSQPPHPSYLDTEWQANAFAGALLMPAMALAEIDAAGDLTEAALVATFGVSREAARVRLNLYGERRKALREP